MKHVAAVAVLVAPLLAAGCGQKRQVKVTFLSDPPGGTLYKHDGQVWGPCPKALWYNLNSEAIKKGYLQARGLIVRWPTGPEKRSEDLIKITINGTERQVLFVQPRSETKVLATDPNAEQSQELDKKAAEWQKAKKSYSTDSERVKTSLELISKKPIAADSQVVSLPGRTLTLGSKQLMSLDYSSLNLRGARVNGRRVVPGPAVEFEIRFPSNSPGTCSLSFVSSGKGGRGDLVGADIRGYEAFALRLTLLSINGSSNPRLKQKLVAGAVIGPTATGRLTSYEPVTLSLAASEKTVTAVTPASADEVYEIGFHVHADNYQEWSTTGTTFVLRIEPAIGAEVTNFRIPAG